MLRSSGVEVSGFIAPTADGSRLGDLPWLGTDEAALPGLDPERTRLVNGVGSTSAGSSARARAFEVGRGRGFAFDAVIDPRAMVLDGATTGEGVQVMAGAIVGVGVRLGDDVLVNTGAIIDHDSVIGAHSHVSPGVAIAGDVRVGESSHIGLGARVLQGVTVGSFCTIGAGAVVLRDVPDRATAVGVPAVSR
jgi:UDP-perosamine 4-acetyltransferase